MNILKQRFKLTNIVVLGLILCLVTPALSQEKLFDHTVDRYSQWTGLNDRGLDIGIKPTELSYVRNINYDNFPYITKREGYDKHTEYQVSADRIRGLFPFYRKNGTRYLVAVINQRVYDITNGCWTELKSGLTNLDIEYDATIFEDKLFITSDSDPLIEFDGTTATNVGGSPPQTAYIEAHAYRIWLAGNCTYPSRLYFCALLDETVWDTGVNYSDVSDAGDPGYIDIEPNDGDRITGLGVLLDSLIIFKERSIWVLYRASGDPDTDWALKRVSADVGCVSNKSIASVRGELFFLSKKGVHSFQGATTTITYAFDNLKAFSLSDPIKGTFDTLSQGQWHKSAGISFDDKYWLSVPGSGSGYNNLVLVFDYVRGAWTVYDGLFSNYFCIFQESSEDELYFGDSRDYGFVYKYGDVHYDGDVQIPATATGEQCSHTLQDTTKFWNTDQFKGCRIHIFCGAGEGQTRTITSNTSNMIFVEPAWSIQPVSGTTLYAIGGIEMVADTGFLPMREPFELHELEKQWQELYVQTKSYGAGVYWLKLYFDIDQTGWSPQHFINLDFKHGDYGTELWGETSFAGKTLITKKVTFPTTAIGKYIKVRIYNYRPNEEVTVYNLLYVYDALPLQYTGIDE